MKEYGDWWTLGFACEAFVVVFINTATAPISAVPEPLASACIAAATAEAAFCFVYTSLNSKAYAVMNAMSEAQVCTVPRSIMCTPALPTCAHDLEFT